MGQVAFCLDIGFRHMSSALHRPNNYSVVSHRHSIKVSKAAISYIRLKFHMKFVLFNMSNFYLKPNNLISMIKCFISYLFSAFCGIV